ncbi:E3 ubiquitin/ISG15 ligase TRIM25-like [Pygocentrus nattereri]|uniref:E3 ubiquitin/ISG15 ligase TRIM25-like n=1 Tax=Pygocentrus nattereri TaxID=42514 RepID=UPI000814A0B3|nr:E3 ubiquitin/ISG15 ligase TRIM25-like [Pygocentrus nattereri]
MSQPSGILEQELSCAICLQLYNDPVSLPCGHSYCLACVQTSQKSDLPGGQPRCPECRQEYDGLESLLRNFKLCGIVEGYRKAMSAGGFKMGKSVVPCDQCLDGTEPAVKTCLHCETSLCQGHLKKHQERHRSKSHALVEPLPDQDQRKCPDHRQELEFLCLEDRSFLCNECVIEGKHRNHEVQTFEAAKSDLKRVLEGLEKATHDRLQMTEALLRRSQETVRNPETSVDMLAAKATSLLDSLAVQITAYKERMRLLIEDEIRECNKTWQASVAAMREYQHQLSNAQRSASELLSSSPADFIFLQLYINLEPQLRQAANVTIPSLPAPQPTNTKRLRASLSTDTFRSELTQELQNLHSLMNPLDLSFNPATLHNSLILSMDLLTVKYWSGAKPSHSNGDQNERFTTAVQVMCSQGFAQGVHVWTVQLGPHCMWSVGLCYASIPRKGDHSKLGHNTLSWRLQWKNKKLTACYDSISTNVGDGSAVPPKRLEVALDYDGGSLAFYSITAKGRKLHLHTFRAAFKETVYPAFGLHSTSGESWITLMNTAI